MKIKKFQAGGPMPQEGAPAQGGGMEEQLAMMAQEIIAQMGPEGAAMLAQIIMQMLEAGAQQEQAQPTFQRRGGKLVMVRK